MIPASTCADHTRYQPGCEPCKQRARAYSRRRYHGIKQGTWERAADPALVRQALLDLLATGATIPRLAKTIGCANSSLYRLRSGKAGRVQPEVARALLQMRPERVRPNPGKNLVDSTGAARRLQALARDGWSSDALSAICGIYAGTLSTWRMRRRPLIEASNHAKVVQVYDKIQSQADPRGPSEMATRWAVKLNYLPSEQWADEDIDDPGAQPLPPVPNTEDHELTTRLIEQALLWPETGKAADYDRHIKREIARRAVNRLGWSWERVAWLMGYKSASTAEYLVHGRPDRAPVRRERKE